MSDHEHRERQGSAVSEASDTPPVSPTELGPADPARLTCWLSGRVQGVGMRWWVRSCALELRLVGWAANRPDGRVEVVAEGSRERLDRLLATLRGTGGPGRITAVVEQWSPARGAGSTFLER